jgi:hypothetical protein
MKALPVILILLSPFLSNSVFAQAVNDNCPSAISLVVNGTCSAPVNGDLTGATQSDTAMTCGAYTSTTAKDLWYQFIAISGTTYYVVVSPSSGLDVVVHLRHGACGSQTTVACEDVNGNGGTEVLVYNATTTGTNYVRLYGYTTATDTPTTNTFTICVSTTYIGIEEQQKEAAFTVFPNPASGIMHLTINQVMHNANLSVYNSLGEKVYTDKIPVAQATDLNIKETPGIYFMVLNDGERQYSRRLVFQ